MMNWLLFYFTMNTAACGGNKKARLSPRPISALPPPNSWQALRAAREKTAPEGGNFRKNTVLVEHIGFEPMTSSMPWKRASQLRQCPGGFMVSEKHLSLKRCFLAGARPPGAACFGLYVYFTSAWATPMRISIQ